MADGVDVLDRAARKKESHFHFVIRLFANRSIGCLLPFDTILRMNALHPFLPNRQARFRIEAVYAVPFFGEMYAHVSRQPRGPTPGVCELLRLRQVRLASLQLSFLQLQGLRSESPIHPAYQQSHREDD